MDLIRRGIVDTSHKYAYVKNTDWCRYLERVYMAKKTDQIMGSCEPGNEPSGFIGDVLFRV
jgi:hypothetical protein